MSSHGERFSTVGVQCLALPTAMVPCKTPITPRGAPSSAASPSLLLPHPRLRPVKEMSQTHEYLSIEYSEEEVWLTWTDKNNDHHEKSIRQLAQEARAGNAHDENVLSYYR